MFARVFSYWTVVCAVFIVAAFIPACTESAHNTTDALSVDERNNQENEQNPKTEGSEPIFIGCVNGTKGIGYFKDGLEHEALEALDAWQNSDGSWSFNGRTVAGEARLISFELVSVDNPVDYSGDVNGLNPDEETEYRIVKHARCELFKAAYTSLCASLQDGGSFKTVYFDQYTCQPGTSNCVEFWGIVGTTYYYAQAGCTGGITRAESVERWICSP